MAKFELDTILDVLNNVGASPELVQKVNETLIASQTSRFTREARAESLKRLIGSAIEAGADSARVEIPVEWLMADGWSPSAWTHSAYWKGNNPGAIAAYDLGVRGSLTRKDKVVVGLVVTPQGADAKSEESAQETEDSGPVEIVPE